MASGPPLGSPLLCAWCLVCVLILSPSEQPWLLSLLGMICSDQTEVQTRATLLRPRSFMVTPACTPRMLTPCPNAACCVCPFQQHQAWWYSTEPLAVPTAPCTGAVFRPRLSSLPTELWACSSLLPEARRTLWHLGPGQDCVPEAGQGLRGVCVVGAYKAGGDGGELCGISLKVIALQMAPWSSFPHRGVPCFSTRQRWTQEQAQN